MCAHRRLCVTKRVQVEQKSCLLANAEDLHKGRCVCIISLVPKPSPTDFPIAIDNTVHSCNILWLKKRGGHGRCCSNAIALSAATSNLHGKARHYTCVMYRLLDFLFLIPP